MILRNLSIFSLNLINQNEFLRRQSKIRSESPDILSFSFLEIFAKESRVHAHRSRLDAAAARLHRALPAAAHAPPPFRRRGRPVHPPVPTPAVGGMASPGGDAPAPPGKPLAPPALSLGVRRPRWGGHARCAHQTLSAGADLPACCCRGGVASAGRTSPMALHALGVFLPYVLVRCLLLMCCATSIS